MNILAKDMISNSEIIKNYKACRDRAEVCGKLFILKNNQPDAVLFSITEYEKLSVFIEYMESLEENDFIKAMEALSDGKKKIYTIEYFRNDAQLLIAIDEIDQERDKSQLKKLVKPQSETNFSDLNVQ
jgi:PHD/YefM family antitoxin component YafN of YafNO toxin-antitoxin module